jgi:dTDP-4-amino-4,6-dideoxygalactose transaminase
LNAALGVAQMESLPTFVENKRNLAKQYQEWGAENGLRFVKETVDAQSNYWLNAVISQDKNQRDEMLKYTNDNNVMTRPAWTPMHQLKINQHCYRSELKTTEWLYERLVNVPSSVILDD